MATLLELDTGGAVRRRSSSTDEDSVIASPVSLPFLRRSGTRLGAASLGSLAAASWRPRLPRRAPLIHGCLTPTNSRHTHPQPALESSHDVLAAAAETRGGHLTGNPKGKPEKLPEKGGLRHSQGAGELRPQTCAALPLQCLKALHPPPWAKHAHAFAFFNRVSLHGCQRVAHFGPPVPPIATDGRERARFEAV